MNYQQMGFGPEERDTFVLNKKCFLKAKTHPVLVIKVHNPWGTEPKCPQAASADAKVQSFGSLTDMFDKPGTGTLEPGTKVKVLKGRHKGRTAIVKQYLAEKKKWGVRLVGTCS